MSLFRNKILISNIKFSLLIIGLSSVGFASGSSGFSQGSRPDSRTLVREFEASVTSENYPWMTAADQRDYRKYVPYERGFVHEGPYGYWRDMEVTNPNKYIKLKQDWLEKRRIDRQNLIEFDESVNLVTRPWMTEEMLRIYHGYKFKEYVATGHVYSLQPITDPKELLDEKIFLIKQMKKSGLPPEEDRRDATIGVNHPNARFIS